MNILFVGEAWGKDEAKEQRPFVGYSGRLLRRLISDAGCKRYEFTNVFNLQPQPTNDITNLCTTRAGGINGRQALTRGKYVRAEYESELERLSSEIEEAKPNLIVALGNTALWATADVTGIMSNRGFVIWSDRYKCKVLPTIHPASVLRQPEQLPILTADIHKAKAESEFPELFIPPRTVCVAEDKEDVNHITTTCLAAPRLSVDIETISTAISCIGFGVLKSLSFVIPFYNPDKPNNTHWPDLETEVWVWDKVAEILTTHPNVLGQNFLFDMHYLWRSYGIPVPGHRNDTMLAHHALQPEMKKGLGFLASIYTTQNNWKMMRKEVTGFKEED